MSNQDFQIREAIKSGQISTSVATMVRALIDVRPDLTVGQAIVAAPEVIRHDLSTYQVRRNYGNGMGVYDRVNAALKGVA